MPDIGGQAAYGQIAFEDGGIRVLNEYVAFVQKMLKAAAAGGDAWKIEEVVKNLSQLAATSTGAEVGYVRRTVGNDGLELFAPTAVYWSLPESDRWGAIPRAKSFRDCINSDGSRQFALTTLPPVSCHSRDYEKHPAIGAYSHDETKYLMGLGSVATARLGTPDAGPPRFLMFLGHRDPLRLCDASAAHRQLGQIQPLLDAAFRVAEGVQDRFDKAQRLKNLTEALPRLALARKDESFWRGVATILTAKSGFRFDRAMIFLYRGGSGSAVCGMAVGGMGGDWVTSRSEVEAAFKNDNSLLAYVNDALDYPEPGTGKCKLRDPLYDAIFKGTALNFDRSRSTELAQWLSSVEKESRPGLDAQPAKRTSTQDAWINEAASRRPGVFFKTLPGNWPTDEYFAFPLVALDANGKRREIGFVLADVCYTLGGHVPGMDMPDLEITGTVLHLIAGMWLARQQEEAYTHTLGAMHALRHHGSKVSIALDRLKLLLPENVKAVRNVNDLLAELDVHGRELGKAKKIVEGIQDERLLTGDPTNPLVVLNDASRSAETFFPNLLFSQDNPHPLPGITLSKWTGEYARIPVESLKQIIDCILDNAAEFGIMQGNGSGQRANVRGAVRLVEVREEGETGPARRILITLENDGPTIDPGLAPFLFCDGVSTRTTKGHGTGLSTARQIAKAYGGDVVLLRAGEPVVFGIVVPIAGNAN